MITSKSATAASAESRFEHAATKHSPWPFDPAFSAAADAVFGFTSIALTCAAPGPDGGESKDS